MNLFRELIENAGRLSRWSRQPGNAAFIWFGKPSVVVAWLGLLLAAMMPPDGFGLPLCWFYSATGIPCPGCGLTRSLSCALRGMLLPSWHYHPMGLLVLGMFMMITVQSLLPSDVQMRLGHFIRSRPVWFKGLYMAFVVTFLGFGIARALFYLGAKWIGSGN